MPLYEFRSKDGNVIETFYHSDDAPDLGRWVTVDGKRYQRIISAPQVPSHKATPSYSAPKFAPGAEYYGRDGTPYYKTTEQARQSAKALGYASREHDAPAMTTRQPQGKGAA